MALFTATAALPASPAAALDHVVLSRDGREQRVSGQILVEAQDGGVMLRSADGVLWRIEPDEIVRRSSDETDFKPLTAKQLADQLLSELPPGFEVHHTKNFVICHDTSRAYAQWCGALFERLYRGYVNYWTQRGVKLEEPRFPLASIVFADRGAYAKYTRGELGDAAASVVGYYSLQTNRVVMYDLTGAEAQRDANDRRGSLAEINRRLSLPESEGNVATIIHEATHQLVLNTGLQQRFADIPLWVSEGLAMFFETPDLKSLAGWRTIGAVNRSRLTIFQKNLPQREAGSLASLLTEDRRFRNTDQAAAAYAEAWALTYYLARRHPKPFVEYLKTLSEKRPLIWDEPEDRLADFKAAFGDDLERIEEDFVRYMMQVR